MLISEPASRRKPRLPLFQARDLLDPLPEALGGDVVAEAVAGRVVGDRHVGVAALAARLGHLLERVAAVGEGGVGVQVAADVVERRPAPAACLRAPPSARRGPRAAPARCRRSRGARRPPASLSQRSTSPLSVSVMPCSETERPRATASSRSCTLWACGAGEVLEQVAEGRRGDDPQVDRDRRCGSGPGRRWARVAGGGDQRVASEVLGQRRRLLGGGDQVDVLAGLGPAPDRAGDLDPVGGRVLAQRRRQLLGDRAHRREQQRGPGPRRARRAAPARRARFPRPSGRGPSASRIRCALGRLLQVLERGDRRARRRGGARFSAPTPGTRVTSIRVGGNFAFSFAAAGISPVSSRASIFSASVLPTPGISVALPVGGQLGDRDRALADRLARRCCRRAPGI